MDEERISDLLLEWEERWEKGDPVTPEELCREFPECLPELARRVECLKVFARALAPDPDAATAPHRSPRDDDWPDVPGYDLLDAVGRGGMAVVYRARDKTLKRTVALKMLRAGDHAPSHSLARMRLEAEVLAKLRHDNIVPVHAAGLHDGRPFIVMELVTGGSLAKHLGRFTDAPRAAATLLADVARAVHFAHEQGVLHRDLKPGNILLDGKDRPLVSDFGLAKLLDAGEAMIDTPPETPSANFCQEEITRLTQSGVLPGTPAYMAPEQLDGAEASKATDVWSLGVVLYEVLAGRRPFTGRGLALLNEVRLADPPSPRVVNGEIDKALERIISKCLHKDPGGRYASAAALADDLERWLRGDLASRPRRLWRRGRRYLAPALSALAVVGVLALMWANTSPSPGPQLSDEERDEAQYQEKVQPMLAQLAAGEAVDLLDPVTRLPKAYRWRGGHGYSGPERSNAPEARFGTETRGLIELLPTPPLQRYRLSAVVSQQLRTNGPKVGRVGIYCSHQRAPTSRGLQHFFFTLDFADLGQEAALYPVVAGGKSVQGSRVMGASRLHTEMGETDEQYHHRDISPSKGYLPPKAKPSAVEGPPRRLDILVTPEKLVVYWEKSDRDTGFLGEVALAEFRDGYEFWRKRLAFLRELAEPPGLMGSVGLYVEDGFVIVRQFRIEPVP